MNRKNHLMFKSSGMMMGIHFSEMHLRATAPLYKHHWVEKQKIQFPKLDKRPMEVCVKGM